MSGYLSPNEAASIAAVDIVRMKTYFGRRPRRFAGLVLSSKTFYAFELIPKITFGLFYIKELDRRRNPDKYVHGPQTKRHLSDIEDMY